MASVPGRGRWARKPTQAQDAAGHGFLWTPAPCLPHSQVWEWCALVSPLGWNEAPAQHQAVVLSLLRANEEAKRGGQDTTPEMAWPQQPPVALEWQTPQSCDGGQGSRGLTVEGPSKPTDKRQLTMSLSVRGSPNWFVSGTDRTGRGGAGVAWGTGKGPGVRVSQRPRPGGTFPQSTPGAHSHSHPAFLFSHTLYPTYTPSVFRVVHLDIFTHIETSHSHT